MNFEFYLVFFLNKFKLFKIIQFTLRRRMKGEIDFIYKKTGNCLEIFEFIKVNNNSIFINVRNYKYVYVPFNLT